jgi:iron complex transport system permease protein
VLLLTTQGLEMIGGEAGLLTLPQVAVTPAAEQRRVVTLEGQLLLGFGRGLVRRSSSWRITCIGRRPPAPASSDGPPRRYRRRRTSYDLARRRQRRVATFIALLAGLLLVAFLASAGIGAVAIPPDHLLAILAAKLGLAPADAVSERESLVLLSIRLPRVVLAVMVGAALACCGAVQQGLFQNPLADPVLLGTSSGAAVAAAATIVLGHSFAAQLPQFLLPYLLPVAAFGGALVATVFIYLISSRCARRCLTMLAGVGVNAVGMSSIGLLIFAAPTGNWDLNYGCWAARRRHLDDADARADLVIPSLIGLLALTAAERALAAGPASGTYRADWPSPSSWRRHPPPSPHGVIGFVGLVVPHLVRMMIGADHRNLLPATILLGTSLVLVADLVARLIVLPAELPIGIVTSFIGTPVFIWLLLMRQRGGV